jgi:hypothetical protein
LRLVLALPIGSAAAIETHSSQSNVPVEVVLRAETPVADPDQVEVDAIFTTPDGHSLRVPAFWFGDNSWRVRYASPELGAHRFYTEVRGDAAGLAGVEGVVAIEPYTGSNPLFQRGPLRVSDNRRHFEHADGTPFFWLGDTWWSGLSHRLSWHGFKTLATDRKEKGFTLIELVGGLPPDLAPLDPREAGEGGQPWDDDLVALRPEFYNAADRRIQHLVEMGLVPCILGASREHLPLIGPTKMRRQWRNLIARYGAYPVMFLVDDHNGPRNEAADTASWNELIHYSRSANPFGSLIGTHETTGRHETDRALLDFRALRTGQSELLSLATLLDWFSEWYDARQPTPLVSSDPGYEGLLVEANYRGQRQRHQFWTALLAGAAGHSYGANGIRQMNAPGHPFGRLPGGENWGETPWPQAMHYPASSQLGYGKNYFESLDWTRLKPASGKVSFASIDLPPLRETRASWIWPSTDASGPVLLGGSIMVPRDGTIRRAVLRVACSAPYGVSINHQLIHRVSDQLASPRKLGHAPYWLFPLLGEYLEPGRNIIRFHFEAEDFGQADALLAHVQIEMADGTMVEAGSSSRWRWTNPNSSWIGDGLEYDPEGSSRVTALDNRSEFPANAEFRPLSPYGPRAAEIPGEQWLVYVPAALPLEVRELPKERDLTLVVFDPRGGETHGPMTARTDATGTWRWEPPREHGDWVLQLTVPPSPR